jgi:dihydroneopterin aldolase
MFDSHPDQIKISCLTVHLPCPITITLNLSLAPHVISHSTSSDTFTNLGVNYSTVSKTIYALVHSRATSTNGDVGEEVWNDAGELIEAVGKKALEFDGVVGVQVVVDLPRGSLVGLARYGATFGHVSGGKEAEGWFCEIVDMKVMALIGLHPHERTTRQPLESDLCLTGTKNTVIGIHGQLGKVAYDVCPSLSCSV